MHTLIMYDRRRDLRCIAGEVSISFGAVQSILIDILSMTKFLARWMLEMLTDDQNRTRFDIFRYLLSYYEDDPDVFY